MNQERNADDNFVRPNGVMYESDEDNDLGVERNRYNHLLYERNNR